ncbi:hypothetical protein BAUCODRAFT_518232 [Baudoinia panamericana UAMH 10762]|uniref:Uncharacterized protein n=1 Tax=Baudoinia panamericana (strain UAMH 10762) TaxID=717646 RepID=M2N7Z1_BAUPA|nr:uncharacterized protein BAUCODRAFT_518232 [Baudoinia panamericana UAMH 10762]EMC94920.1 hypothetical protein BAUCODRAFT_518232 [Baudoinia panamericana UAMH 10762]
MPRSAIGGQRRISLPSAGKTGSFGGRDGAVIPNGAIRSIGSSSIPEGSGAMGRGPTRAVIRSPVGARARSNVDPGS